MSKGRVLVICWILLSSQFAGADCVAAAARLVQQPGAVTNDGLFTCSRSLQSEEQNVITKIITNGISCRIPSSQRILSIIDEHSAPDMAHSRRYDANLWHKTSRNWEKWWVMTRGQWDGLAVISWPIKDEDFYLATHSCTHRLYTFHHNPLPPYQARPHSQQILLSEKHWSRCLLFVMLLLRTYLQVSPYSCPWSGDRSLTPPSCCLA